MLAAATSCGSSVTGREFRTENDLLAASGDWVVVGRFDVAFPARVVDLQEGRDGVQFLRGSTPQIYSGLTGYDLRVLQLDGGGRPGWLVLRGREKRAEPSAPGR